MKIGDLVKNSYAGLGIIMEEETNKRHNLAGYWVCYFNEPAEWRWYSFEDRYDIEVLSENR